MQELDYNISRVLSHTLVYEARESHRAAVGDAEFYNGDPPAPTAQESTDQMLRAYISNLPDLMRTTSQQVLPTERTMLDAQREIAPGQAQLDQELFARFGPEFARIAADIDAQNRMRQSQADADILRGPGREVMRSALEAQREADPEYFRQRENMDAQLSRLYASLDDPNAGLSGAEQAEIDRSLARGNIQRGIMQPTAQSTVANAMAFGQAGEARKQQRQAAIGQALGVGTAAAPTMRSGIDTFQMVTGRPSFNTGADRVGGAQQVGQQSFQMGGQLMNNINQSQMNSLNYAANRRSGLDRANQTMSSVGNLAGGICCFIFAEAYYGNIPWFVRASRDRHYTPEIRQGYVRMAKWLVPLMAQYTFVRKLVWETMIQPLTEHAGWLYKVPGFEAGAVREPFKRFWLNLWRVYGWLGGIEQTYGDCRGRSWRIGRWQLEHWNVPAGVSVPAHTHAEFDSVLVPVAGAGQISRGDKTRKSKLWRGYSIKRGVAHAVAAGRRGFSFLNFQRWYSKPTSAAVDFKEI